jgi:NAD(P)-dependent dehydrogenase (short-subunit alcohol dehydrogenase family)
MAKSRSIEMKIALVTGAAAGIGAEISRRFAREGIAVGVLDINLADATNIAVDELLMTLPVRRVGEPEDIANAAVWLVSDASGYVTGQTIGVNGAPDPMACFAAI